MELLLELYEPVGRQVDVLEQDPAAGLGGSGDGLVGVGESLGRADGDRDDGCARLGRELLDQTARIEARHRAHEHGRLRANLALDNRAQVEHLLGLLEEARTERLVHEQLGRRREAIGSHCFDQQQLLEVRVELVNVERRLHDACARDTALKRRPNRKFNINKSHFQHIRQN